MIHHQCCWLDSHKTRHRIQLTERGVVIIEFLIFPHSGPVIRAVMWSERQALREGRLNLASFGSPWFMQTLRYRQDQVNSFLFCFLFFFFFFFFVLLKRLNNAVGYIVWSNISKNRRVAVKLKINIQPLQDDKRVKQTCSDALDAPVAADNNGWNLKARFWGKTDTNKKKKYNIARQPAETIWGCLYNAACCICCTPWLHFSANVNVIRM